MYKTNFQITANASAADEEGEAHARPKQHQPVPSQYRKWWVMGQRTWSGGGEREKNLFWGPCLGSFGGNVLLGRHATQKKQG